MPYEFGGDREEHIQTGDMMIRAAVMSAALFWNQLVILHDAADEDFLVDTSLQEMRQKLAAQLSSMADALSQAKAVPAVHAETLLTPAIMANVRHAEYATNTARRFAELQKFTVALSQRW